MKSSLPPILCLGFPAWEGDYQKSTVQLMRALAREQEVLYVEYPFSWKDVWQGFRHNNKPYRRIMGLEPRLRAFPTQGPGRLHVLTLPPIFPVNGLEAGSRYEALASANARKVLPVLLRAMKKLGYQKPLIINAFNPFIGVYLQPLIESSGSYYYCYDQIGAARWTHRHGPRLEARLLEQSDGIITSSLPLLEEKRGNLPGVVVKNGVNLALFEQAFREAPRKGEGPVLGYLGSIDDRIDLDLLEALLEQWPAARLLMVGRIMEPAIEQRLAAHPRIELAGAQQPAELPAWVTRMDIGLIPFVTNEFTRFIYPLKINEYLAAGLPVVSTAFSDLSDFEGVIEVGTDAGQYLAGCRRAWEEDSPVLRQERRKFASLHTWEARAATLAAWLAAQIPEP